MARFTQTELSFLREQKLGRLATVAPDGSPHNVPVGFALQDGDLYISTDPQSKKVRNLRRDSRAAFLVDVPGKPRRAVLVHGIAELMEAGPQYLEAQNLFATQRGWAARREGEQVVIRIRAKRKVSWGFD